jgi:hypothetical protein
MPAKYIAVAVAEFAPEPILRWCNGLSQEARYTSSVGGGGSAAAGKAIGNAILRRQLTSARLGTAVRMPRYPVIAVGATRIYIFDGPIAKAGPIATLSRDQVEVIQRRGPMWRRLDLIVPADGGSRSYTIMFFALFGNKRLRGLLTELANPAPPRAR